MWHSLIEPLIFCKISSNFSGRPVPDASSTSKFLETEYFTSKKRINRLPLQPISFHQIEYKSRKTNESLVTLLQIINFPTMKMMILEQGKRSGEVNSYRLISLLPATAKCFQQCISAILERNFKWKFLQIIGKYGQPFSFILPKD